MRGNDRTRGAYGIITNKSLKKGPDYCRYSSDFDFDFFEHLNSKVKNKFLCRHCSSIKNENLKLHEHRQRVLEI